MSHTADDFPSKNAPIVPRRLPEIAKFLRISLSSLYERFNPNCPAYDPTFPKPFKTGIRSVALNQRAIERWLQAQVEQSDS